MAETLTEVDSFDATIQWPTASELASAADVRDKAIQRLANRTRNNKNRIDVIEPMVTDHESRLDDMSDHEARIAELEGNHFFHGYLSGSVGSSPGSNLFTITARDSNGITVSGGNTLAFTRNGSYLVTWYGTAASNDTSNPALIDVALNVDSTAHHKVRSYRFTASAGDATLVSGSGVVTITNAAVQDVSVRNITSGQTVSFPLGAGSDKYSGLSVVEIGHGNT